MSHRRCETWSIDVRLTAIAAVQFAASFKTLMPVDKLSWSGMGAASSSSMTAGAPGSVGGGAAAAAAAVHMRRIAGKTGDSLQFLVESKHSGSDA
nr:hypothetical protein CFP56_50334 [Quercus suber]